MAEEPLKHSTGWGPITNGGRSMSPKARTRPSPSLTLCSSHWRPTKPAQTWPAGQRPTQGFRVQMQRLSSDNV